MAMLQYRNTPCRFLLQSPAQILFARRLKDGIPMTPGSLNLRPEWVMTAERREKALAKYHLKSNEVWSRYSRQKSELLVGQCVAVQNQHGLRKLKWEMSGVIIKILAIHHIRWFLASK